jgi:DNA-binding NtrC family response regulator
MNIIQEYKIITEKIAVVKSQLISAKRDLRKNMNLYKPADSRAITYDKEKVQTSMQQQDFIVTAKNICILTNFINELQEELEELYKQREELEKTINSLGDIEKQFIMYKTKDPKMPMWKIANKLHIDRKTLYRHINKNAPKCPN